MKPTILARLFIHETQQVYSDRFVSEEEIQIYDGMFKDVMKKTYRASRVMSFLSLLSCTQISNRAQMVHTSQFHRWID